ncbi:hypothetical protein MMC11_003165 [Xylographa trunciseda]|nr:hypothetical protein [Xylographa trunciseda]
MATPAFGASSRRKPATYAKASRRGFATRQSFASNKLSFDQSEDTLQCERTISGRIRKDGATSPPELCLGSPGSSVDHDEPLPVVCNRSQSRSVTPAIVTTENYEGYQNDVIYDVPSSDEQSSVSFGLRVGSSSKRRKLNAMSMKKYSNVVWDDDSLQRHVATEAAAALGKKIKGHEPQDPSIKKPNSSPTTMRTDLSIKPRRIIRQPGLCGTSTEDKVEMRIRAGVALAISASSTKSQHEIGLVSRTPVAWSGKALPGVEVDHFEYTKFPANIPMKRVKHVLSDTSSTNNSSLPVIQKRSGGSRDSSCRNNSISAHRIKIEKPIVRNRRQNLSPENLEISSLDIASSESASRIPHIHNKIDHRAQGLTHNSPSRMKIKDRLHTPRKTSAPLRKDGFEIDSDSDSESSLGNSSSRRSQTNSNPPSETALSSTIIEGSESQSLSSIGGLNRQNGVLKVTYGRQRSFLTDDYLGEGFSTTTPESDVMQSAATANLANPLNGRLKPQNLSVLSEAMDESADPNTGTIRSIHELREAGSNARMTRDIEATLDDIDERSHTPVSLRRSGLLEVAAKLQQPEFCCRFINLGLESRLLAYVDSCSDTIAGILLLTAMLQVMAHPVSRHTLSEFALPGVLNFLGRYLECQEDLKSMVRSRKSNMSKALQAEVFAFCASFMLADVWRSGHPTRITGRILSLQCLEYIVRHQREAGSTSDILSHEILERLTEILIPSHNAVVLTLESGETAEVQLSLSILESSSIAYTKCSDGQDMLWTSGSIAKMTEFLSIIQTRTGPQAGSLRTLALRLCLNLTNNNPAVCHVFSDPNVIHATLSMIGSSFSTLLSEAVEESSEIVVDNLVLSLGLLINLAEWNERTRELFLLSHEDKPHPLSTLSKIFESNIERTSEVTSEKEIKFNVPFGYLSILLSFLCMSASIRQHLRMRLRGQMLGRIFGAVEEFLDYHRQITDEIREAAEGDDFKANFVSRVQSVVDRLKREEQVYQGEASRK